MIRCFRLLESFQFAALVLFVWTSCLIIGTTCCLSPSRALHRPTGLVSGAAIRYWIYMQYRGLSLVFPEEFCLLAEFWRKRGRNFELVGTFKRRRLRYLKTFMMKWLFTYVCLRVVISCQNVETSEWLAGRQNDDNERQSWNSLSMLPGSGVNVWVVFSCNILKATFIPVLILFFFFFYRHALFFTAT